MDWGSYHPYACYWIAVDYDGVMYVYRELYGYGGKANVGTKEPSTVVAQRIADSESADKRLIQYGVLDNACWGKQDPGAPSIAEEINRVLMVNGCRMFNPSVKGREQVGEEIRLRLQGYEDANGKRYPGIKIFSTCFHLIRTLPEITHDKNQPEKYDTNGEDHCLIAGTLITTMRGDIPIEQVTTNDYVLTRKGFKRVIKSALTRRAAKVKTITADNGRTLTGTGNHPVFCFGKGFIPLDSIKYGDIMYSIGGAYKCQENNPVRQTALYLTESHSDAIQIPNVYQTEDTIVRMGDCENKVSVICTELYGNTIMEQSRKAITSTTKTKTRLTIVLKILNCCQAKHILNYMQQKTLKTKSIWHELKKISIQFVRKLMNGIVQKLGMNGMLNMENKLLQKKDASRKLSVFAKCAERHTMLCLQKPTLVDSAPKPVLASIDDKAAQIMLLESAAFAEKSTKLTNTEDLRLVVKSVVLSCREEQEPADVYNLTVDEVHEYFANGFLVHNCVDAIGYACMSRPWKPERPRKQGKRDGWKFDYGNERGGKTSFMGV